MSGIFLPQRWKRKPSGLLALNESSPFIGNPIFLHAMNGPQSLTGRAHLYSSSGAIWGADTAEGTTLVEPAGIYDTFTVSGDFTLLVRFKTTDTKGAIFGGRESTSDNPVLNFTVGHNGVGDFGAGNLLWTIRDNASSLGHSAVPIAGTVNDGAWHTCILARRAWATSTFMQMYIDGRLISCPSSTSGVNGPITLGGALNASYLNDVRDSSIGQLSPASVSLGFLTQGALLSELEAQELSKNPWQLVRKDTARVYFFPSAGGGGATGSFAVQEPSPDTASFAGDVIVQGSFSPQEGGVDSATFAGLVKVQGSFSIQEPSVDTSLFEGQVVTPGSVTLSAATVLNVTRTTATPRVTVTFS